jgi:hypothetical protein
MVHLASGVLGMNKLVVVTMENTAARQGTSLLSPRASGFVTARHLA